MAKSEYFTASSEQAAIAIADQLAPENSIGRRQYGNGPAVMVKGAEIELYGGNARERADFIRRAMTAEMRNATPAPEQPKPATDRQIAYLASLIENDPGFASTIGAHISRDLRRDEASRMIDQMLSNR